MSRPPLLSFLPALPLVPVAAALAVALVGGCGDRDVGPDLGDATLNKGQAAFRRFCVECHGVAGDGKGPAAKFQPKPPRSFVTEGFRFRYDGPTDRVVEAARGSVTEQDLLRTITEGLPNSTMPAFAPLPPEERLALVAYVRHLARDSASPGKPAPVRPPTPRPPAPRPPTP